MSAPKAGIGTALLVLAVLGIWFLTRDDHKSDPEPSTQSSAQKTDYTSASQDNPDSAPITIRSEQSDLEQTNREFAKEDAKLLSLSSEDRFGPYKAEIDSLMRDAELFRDMTKSAYGACINSNADATVYSSCLRHQVGFRQSWTALFVDNLLSKLPDISKAQLQGDCDGFFATVAKHRSDNGSLLDKLTSDPNGAARSGISIDELESLSKRAAEYQSRAQAARDSDLVLSYILICHSNLLLEEFGWRTWDYNATILGGQPLRD